MSQTGSEGDIPEEQPGEDSDRRLTIILLIVAIVAVLALVGLLAFQRFQIPNPFVPAPTPAVTAEPAPTAVLPPGALATPTPTRVVAEPSPTVTKVAVSVVIAAPVIGERVRNGSFEDGFENQSVAREWTAFNNGAAIFEFLGETWPPAVLDGEYAQRIQVREATQLDRYAGIYQKLSVVSGEPYDLTLHGQIRTGLGDINASQYGYRMQLGIDYSGGEDWTAVDDWVELPWDEQRFDSDSLFFYDYITPVTATSSNLTIFIRSWNKWPDPGRVEYTLDAISLMGPVPSEELMVDKALPVTGNPPLSLVGGIRLLASLVVLCLLVAGAVWQARRRLG